MPRVKVDAQGRLVLPQQVRRSLRIQGRAGELLIEETGEGVLLVAPEAAASVSVAADGLPLISFGPEGEAVSNDEVLAAIDEDRAAR